MRNLPSEISSYLASNAGIVVRQLLWVEAKNRSTGEVETIGFWSGEDHIQFVIDGDTRTYYGSGQFIGFNELVVESSLTIRRLTATVVGITPEIETVLRNYDPKMAPTQVHLAFFSATTNNLLAPPVRVDKGWIDKFTIKTPIVNDKGEGSIQMMGNTRYLTRRLPFKRSDQTQKKRLAGDTFYNDVTITGQVSTPWGSKV